MQRSLCLVFLLVLFAASAGCGDGTSAMAVYPLTTPDNAVFSDQYPAAGGSYAGDSFIFTVASPGVISVEATWSGTAANLGLIVTGPLGAVCASNTGPSPLALSCTVTADDVSAGSEWTVAVVPVDVGSVNGRVVITYPK